MTVLQKTGILLGILGVCAGFTPKAGAAELLLNPAARAPFFASVAPQAITLVGKAAALAKAPIVPCRVIAYGSGDTVHVSLAIAGDQQKASSASLARIVMEAAYAIHVMSDGDERPGSAELLGLDDSGEFTVVLAEAIFDANQGKGLNREKAADKGKKAAKDKEKNRKSAAKVKREFPGPAWPLVATAARGLSDKEIFYLRNFQAFHDESGEKRAFFENPANRLSTKLERIVSRQMGIAPGSVNFDHLVLRPYP